MTAKKATVQKLPVTQEVSMPAPMVPLQDILRVAIEKGVDFKELLAAQKEMIAYEEQRVHARALAQFQANLPPIPHNKRVMNKPPRQDTVRYTYADLDQIMTIARPALGENQISVTWDSEVADGVYKATAYVRCGGHVTQATFSSAIDADAYMTDQQKGASANKFAMRNAVIMALGLTSCGMEDDDGQAAGADPKVTEEQAMELQDMLEQTKGDVAKFKRIYNIKDIPDMPAAVFDNAMALLKNRKAKLEAAK